MLSFRLVDTDSFKQLMAMAVPQYVVPSRHYFSKTAVPSMHNQVSDKIKCEQYICTTLHVLTDGLAPFNFWVSKLSTWPELAFYALAVEGRVPKNSPSGAQPLLHLPSVQLGRYSVPGCAYWSTYLWLGGPCDRWSCAVHT